MNRNLPATFLRHLLWLTLAAMPLRSHAIEWPDHEVIRKLDTVELHQYATYLVADLVLNANADEAGNQVFAILAGCIFGKDRGERKFAMTAPATQSANP